MAYHKLHVLPTVVAHQLEGTSGSAHNLPHEDEYRRQPEGLIQHKPSGSGGWKSPFGGMRSRQVQSEDSLVGDQKTSSYQSLG